MKKIPRGKVGGGRGRGGGRGGGGGGGGGGLPITKYCRPSQLADEENFSFQTA